MLQTRQHSSIEEIARAAWDGLWPGEAEDWAYYAAAEKSLPAGFAVSYVGVYDGDALMAAAPVFHTEYELHSSLRGRVRSTLDTLAQRFPQLLRLGVTGLGSPLVDRCHIGLSPSMSPERQALARTSLVEGMAESARRRGHRLLAVKDLEDPLMPRTGRHLEGLGFARIRGLPNSHLDLPHASWDAFLKTHPRSYRRYVKAKERELPRLRIEFPENIGNLSPRLHALFEQTREQSAGNCGDFEDLDPGYFDAVKQRCGDRAQFMLCWLGDELVSFQMYMVGEREVVAKFIGMDPVVARDLNLYFININQLIRVCIAAGIPHLRLGNTAYAVKAAYKARFATHWIYFRHRYRVVTWLLRRLAPLIDYERNDPELSRLRDYETAKAASPAE